MGGYVVAFFSVSGVRLILRTKRRNNIFGRIHLLLLTKAIQELCLQSPYLYILCIISTGLRCFDGRDECPNWAAAGDCVTNGWTERTCRISCKTKCDNEPVKPQGTKKYRDQDVRYI